jgi:chromosome partitioning protein
MQSIAITGTNGGVGTTTLTHELGSVLAAMGKRVLVIALTCNGSWTPGFPDIHTGKGAAELLGVAYGDERVPCASVKKLIVRSPHYAIDVIRAGPEDLAREYFGFKSREMFSPAEFASNLDSFSDAYDYILLDCQRGGDALTMYGFLAADWILCVMEPTGESISGLKHFISSVREASRKGASAKLLGLIFNKFDAGKLSYQKIIDFCREQLQGEFRFVKMIQEAWIMDDAHLANYPVMHFSENHPINEEVTDLAEAIQREVRFQSFIDTMVETPQQPFAHQRFDEPRYLSDAQHASHREADDLDDFSFIEFFRLRMRGEFRISTSQ